MSGGFPHSDISGSKPIPGSPKLNAGYHVLHRLLLPRHPPNALFALDLIQEEHDRLQAMNPAVFLKSIACTFPPLVILRCELASVLDLEQYHLLRSGCSLQANCSLPLASPYSGPPDDTDVNLYKRCQLCPGCYTRTHPLQDDQTHKMCLMIMQVLVIGGAYRDRTDDLLNANQALSQLS